MNKEETKLHQLNMTEKEKATDGMDSMWGYEIEYISAYVREELFSSHHEPYTTESRIKFPKDKVRLMKDLNTKSIRSKLTYQEFHAILDNPSLDTPVFCDICKWVYEFKDEKSWDMERFEINTCCPSLRIVEMENVSEKAWQSIDLEAHKSCIEKINNGTMTWKDVIKYKDETDKHWAVKKVVGKNKK
tara:strand:- start:44 stop:607 length:564 start_codon:yes stop_codon:yes gene_type:complete